MFNYSNIDPSITQGMASMAFPTSESQGIGANVLASVSQAMAALTQDVTQMAGAVFNPSADASALQPLMQQLAQSTPANMMQALQGMYNGTLGSGGGAAANAGFPNPYGAQGPFAALSNPSAVAGVVSPSPSGTPTNASNWATPGAAQAAAGGGWGGGGGAGAAGGLGGGGGALPGAAGGGGGMVAAPPGGGPTLGQGGLDQVGAGMAAGGSNQGGQWNANDNAMINQITSAGTGTWSNNAVEASWGQTVEGNCASVAMIKAGMEQYGNKMFSNVQQTAGGGYNVTLQDGKQVSVTAQDLQTTAQMANFKGNGGPEQAYATLAFAVEAKNGANQGFNGQHSIQGVLQSLNSGAYAQQPAQLLGLENDLQQINPNQIQGQNGVIGVSSDHAISIGMGANGQEMADHYGTQQAFNGTDTRGGKLQAAYQLKPMAGVSAAAPGGNVVGSAVNYANPGGATTTGPGAGGAMTPDAIGAAGNLGGAGMIGAGVGGGAAAPAAPPSDPSQKSGQGNGPNGANGQQQQPQDDGTDAQLYSDAGAAEAAISAMQNGGTGGGALAQLNADLANAQSDPNAVPSASTMDYVDEVMSEAQNMG
jgi:hypothetical protein